MKGKDLVGSLVKVREENEGLLITYRVVGVDEYAWYLSKVDSHSNEVRAKPHSNPRSLFVVEE